MVQDTEDFEGGRRWTVKDGGSEASHDVAADGSELVRPVRLPELGEFGELKEPVDGRVEVVKEAPSGRRVLLSNGRSDRVDVLLSERLDVGDERARHEWADLRVRVRTCLASARRRARRHAASMGTAGPELTPSMRS